MIRIVVRLLWIICFVSGTFIVRAAAPRPCIGIFADHVDAGELKAMGNMLSEKGFRLEMVHWKDVHGVAGLERFYALWYHRTDTVSLDAAERAGGRWIRDYVQRGGHLLLSMEAAPLLNAWGIETNAISMRMDTVTDEGFGRPLGFHAFRDHPVFDSLQGGGVYCSKRRSDHVARKWGFFGADTPREGRVIGIQWTYITFTEANKLLLEYRRGKGSIIAAGAYMYYDADNDNREHLARLTANIFRYMRSPVTGGGRYWPKTLRTIVPGEFPAAAVPVAEATRWTLPAPSLQLPARKGSTAFYDLTGRRILWMGRLDGGAEEIWTHPFMALRDMYFGVRLKGRDSICWLHNVPAEVVVTPEFLLRTYRLSGNAVVREVYTVSFDKPCGVAHLEMEGGAIEGLAVRFASHLRLMWPYSPEATGNIRYGFSRAANGHIISGADDAMSAAVLYSAKPLRQESVSVAGSGKVDFSAEFAAPSSGAFNVYILGEEGGWRRNLDLFRRRHGELSHLFVKSSGYYKRLLGQRLGFVTPDSVFDEGYRWALVRTDQFLQTTPGVGTSLMAGFGTTARGWDGRQQPSGRPGYAWYFGRDGEWSAMAVDAYGDYPMVKKMLETFIRWQDVSGKIYHELTSSGAVHYDAADATPLFVVLAAHYLRYTGDTVFIRRHWAAIRKAMDFCYSTDTDGDGLIENTNVGHGWIEGGVLYGTHTEFYLAACWAAALGSAARLAVCAGDAGLAETYRRDEQRVKRIVDRDFWNPREQFFYNGKMKDGTYMEDPTVLAAVAIDLHTVSDSAKAGAVSDRLAGSAFTTDWGLRMIEDSNPHYKAGSYHAGMVWPLYAGWASLADFHSGRYLTGYEHLMNNLLHYRKWSPGSIEETFNGDRYVPNGVCSHQCWSEAMVLLPAAEGMLGLDADAGGKGCRLAPYFPWDWKYARVTNIPLGGRVFAGLDMERGNGSTIYKLDGSGKAEMTFAPAFPPGTDVKDLRFNGDPLSFTTRRGVEAVTVECRLKLRPGNNKLEVFHHGGIGILPAVPEPVQEAVSSGVRILSQRLRDDCYAFTLEGRSGDTCRVRVADHVGVKSAEGARIVSEEQGVLTVSVVLPAEPLKKYTRTEVRLYFNQ